MAFSSLKSLRDNVITRNYTLDLFLASALLTLSSANFAFDNQGFSQTQAMDVFVRRFGDQTEPKPSFPSSFLSFSNAFPLLLLVCGIVIGSAISNKYGRRMTVFVMSIWAICCVPIVATSQSRSQFLAGRCLNSIYIGMEMSVVPVFQSEIVPARVRGLAVASYQMSFAFGGFVISAICHRTAMLRTDWSWRIPFLCYLFVPSVVAILIWRQPESPRWLVSQDRIEEARQSLRRIRKSDHDVSAELQEIVDSIQAQRQQHQEKYATNDELVSERKHFGAIASTWQFVKEHKECFDRVHRRRTFIVLAVNFFLQATGSAFSSLYGPLIIKEIGSLNPFSYSMINNGLGAFVYLINISINDRVGRRPIMLISAALQAACLFIIAGIGAVQTESTKELNVVLSAFLILHSVGFCFGWAPLSYLISAEVPAQLVRDRTTRMGFAVGIVTQFVVAFTVPYLVYNANLHLRVGFIYGPLSILAGLWAYLYLPECFQLSLEQVNTLFEKGVPAPRSRAWGKEIRRKEQKQDVRLQSTSEQDSEIRSNDDKRDLF